MDQIKRNVLVMSRKSTRVGEISGTWGIADLYDYYEQSSIPIELVGMPKRELKDADPSPRATKKQRPTTNKRGILVACESNVVIKRLQKSKIYCIIACTHIHTYPSIPYTHTRTRPSIYTYPPTYTRTYITKID